MILLLPAATSRNDCTALFLGNHDRRLAVLQSKGDCTVGIDIMVGNRSSQQEVLALPIQCVWAKVLNDFVRAGGCRPL